MKLAFVPTMPIVCCRCQLVTGWVVTVRERAHLASHGYCRTCAAKIKLQIRKP